MGAFFDLEQANVLGWLTWPSAPLEPLVFDRASALRLAQLLSQARILSEGEEAIFARDERWLSELEELGKSIFEAANADSPEDRLLGALLSAKQTFSQFALYALAIYFKHEDRRRIHGMVSHLAMHRGESLLFLAPTEPFPTNDLDLTRPFPALELLGELPEETPQVLMWTPTQRVALLGLEEADMVLHHLQPHLDYFRHRPFGPRESARAQKHIDEELERHQVRRSSPACLLQVSDLHFGTTEATRAERYLIPAIKKKVEEDRIKRVVVTGDLMDNPTEAAAQQFVRFREAVHGITGKDPIVIPGNHDMKLFGNIGGFLGQLAGLEWSNVVADHELGLAFLCFDSSREAALARGRVTQDQRLDVAAKFDTLLGAESRVGTYLRVALLHHHPVKYGEEPKAKGFWRLLQWIGLKEEMFLQMEGGDEFLDWCAHREVPLVLHGHKHVPHHAVRDVDVEQGNRRVETIGCGTSTGAGGYPLTFNTLAWDPDKRKWAASFYSDPGDGRGFSRQKLRVTTVR